MPRDEQRPIRFTIHAEIRLSDRNITKAQAEQAIRAGAWQPNGLNKWRARAPFGARTIDVVFVEKDEVQGDGKQVRVIEVLLVLTVIDVGRFNR